MNEGVCALVMCAGIGTRMQTDVAKQFLRLGDKPVLAWTLDAFDRSEEVDSIVIVTFAGDTKAESIAAALHMKTPYRVVTGGATRQQSVRAGLNAADSAARIVVVHDAARPLVSQDEISSVIRAAKTSGAATLAVRAKETVKIVEGGQSIAHTPDRDTVWLVRTPQAFDVALLHRAHAKAENQGVFATDDSSLVERLGIRVEIVEGDERNIKITNPSDLVYARAIVRSEAPRNPECFVRTGIGYDAHRFKSPKGPAGFVVLGGVRIPFAQELQGHSDADVLVHAVMDAVLGACGGPDIGVLFPDTAPEYLGADSIVLANQVARIIEERGYSVCNIDSTVIAEAPKVSPHKRLMEANLAKAFDIAPDRVTVKASTNEGMGFVGRREGIACVAVATVLRR